MPLTIPHSTHIHTLLQPSIERCIRSPRSRNYTNVALNTCAQSRKRTTFGRPNDDTVSLPLPARKTYTNWWHLLVNRVVLTGGWGEAKRIPKTHPNRKIRFGHDGIVCGACGRTRVCVVVQSIVGAVRARSNKGKHLKSTSNHTYTERKRDIRSNKVTTAVELRKLVKNEGARAEQNKDVTCISLQGLQARQDKQRKWGNIILPHPLPTN